MADAGRVIAGTAKGIRLRAPGPGTRPLADRVKQTLFAILEPDLRDARVLDLFAGSGAAGIEALSRGSSRAVFVDSDRKAIESIERNLAATGLAGPNAVVSRNSVTSWLVEEAAKAGSRSAAAQGPFSVIVLDPPYDSPWALREAIERIGAAGPGTVLAPDGIVAAKHFWKELPLEVPLLASVRQERFGETMLTFHRWADEATSDEVVS